MLAVHGLVCRKPCLHLHGAWISLREAKLSGLQSPTVLRILRHYAARGMDTLHAVSQLQPASAIADVAEVLKALVQYISIVITIAALQSSQCWPYMYAASFT